MMRRLVLLTLGLLLAGCGVQEAFSIPQADKIALLAPFEGRYREIGYAAIYPARLAMQDLVHPQRYELLALDDGGSETLAYERARALALDPNVKIVLVQGYAATAPQVLAAFGDKPVIVMGDWGVVPAPNVFILSHADLATRVTDPRLSVLDAANVSAPYVGGDVFGLPQLSDLREDLNGLTFLTSGSLPPEDFRQRILNSDPFAAEPNHLSMLTYDAVRLAAQALESKTPLTDLRYEGLSGEFTFSASGYWQEASINTFAYVDGVLTPQAPN